MKFYSPFYESFIEYSSSEEDESWKHPEVIVEPGTDGTKDPDGGVGDNVDIINVKICGLATEQLTEDAYVRTLLTNLEVLRKDDWLNMINVTSSGTDISNLRNNGFGNDLSGPGISTIQAGLASAYYFFRDLTDNVDTAIWVFQGHMRSLPTAEGYFEFRSLSNNILRVYLSDILTDHFLGVNSGECLWCVVFKFKQFWLPDDDRLTHAGHFNIDFSGWQGLYLQEREIDIYQYQLATTINTAVNYGYLDVQDFIAQTGMKRISQFGEEDNWFGPLTDDLMSTPEVAGKYEYMPTYDRSLSDPERLLYRGRYNSEQEVLAAGWVRIGNFLFKNALSSGGPEFVGDGRDTGPWYRRAL